MKNALIGAIASGLLLALSTTAQAGPITVDGGWYGFCFAGVGSGATASCQNSGVGVSGNSTTFTALGDVLFNVTDAFNQGDQFEVIVNGVSYFTSNVPSAVAGVTDPDAAFADAAYSHVSILLGAGVYTVDIFATVSPFNGGGAYLQAVSAAVPEPVTLSIFGAGLLGAAAMRRRKKSA